MSDNPGMMGEAYFVGKRELLRWINDFLDLSYTKVEQTATGAAHCQILDAIFPGKVPLSKVNFDAKYDYEYVKNFKVLQIVFEKMNIQKHIPVQKLIKAKYQDNLEFLQWMKNFFDVRHSGDNYDAVGRRNAALKKQGKKIKPTAPRLTQAKSEGKRVGVNKKTNTRSTAQRSSSKPRSGTMGTMGRSSGDSEKKLKAKDKAVAELNSKVEEMAGHIELLEKERTFYYSKLRSIEILLQDLEGSEADSSLKEKILQILYKTDEGFEAPPEEEAVDPSGGQNEF